MTHIRLLFSTVIYALLSCNESNKQTHFISATIEVAKDSSNFQAFLRSNFYFYSKYSNPVYEPYGKLHWENIDTARQQDKLIIVRTSSCSETELNNEHYNYYGECLLRQVVVINTKINKTVDLLVASKERGNRIRFSYDRKQRLESIIDSFENKEYQFTYSERDLTEVKEFKISNGQNDLKLVIKFRKE